VAEKTYTITEDTATVYKVRPDGRHGSWAVATIREWPQGGSLDVQSDEGNFSYSWTSIGPDRFTDFLRSLEYDYFMGKAHPGSGRRFDFEASVKDLRHRIREARREGRITKEVAREHTDLLKGLEHTLSHEAFCHQLHYELGWVHDYDDAPGVMIDDFGCRRFWDGPWKALCAHWAQATAKAA
jgi:hypothetical protein